MILFKRAGDLKGWLEKQKAAGKSIGFVPTMGALHAGHISLITISKEVADLSICSIFVNPTQFNDPKDFQKYPITLDKDIAFLERAGVDILFLPEVVEVYPGGTTGLETYDLGTLEAILEGKYRPGHFQGVCQVMRRLLDLVGPDHLFMGQKDYQQCMVLQRLLTLRGMKTQLHLCPIIREPDGLAMSSRNMRLTQEQRKKATAIYQALLLLKKGWVSSGSTGTQLGEEMLKQADFQIDYIAIAHSNTLEPVQEKAGAASGILALIAAFQGEVRLIDNMILA
jgi:pantoate--beta-alanine ligase